MRILQVHNQYFTGFGGEDTVVKSEKAMLEKRGHDVRQLIVSTTVLKNATIFKKISAAAASVWSRSSYEIVEKEVAAFKPDIVHIHNSFPLLSPSIYYAARANGACVVQTLHNYRIPCANGFLLRDGKPCDLCVGHTKWRGVIHRCYSGSLPISATVVAGQTFHKIAGTFQNQVDAFIALTSFQRDIHIREGLPADQLFVKPNFILDTQTPIHSALRENQIAYIGNIRKEKGTDILLEAWSKVQPKGYRLLLFGHGPDQQQLQSKYAGLPSIVWGGVLDTKEVMRTLAKSKYIATCSRWYETFGMVLLEAFSVGTPAIAPNHGALRDLVQDTSRGFLFEPNSVEGLVDVLREATSVDEERWQQMSKAASQRATEFTEQSNYDCLLDIYDCAKQHFAREHLGKNIH